MRRQSVSFFTEKEEEFVNLLIAISMSKYVANMLIFLVNTPEATSREIERGTDMHQPEVSLTIKYLFRQEWIKSREIPSDRKDRPRKTYSLAVPVNVVLATIEKEKKDEVKRRLALVRKIIDYL
ncbi:MAG: ArsR family transcriptional regulator [Methanoregula sp.]|jgi:predicted transcriptional regulator